MVKGKIPQVGGGSFEFRRRFPLSRNPMETSSDVWSEIPQRVEQPFDVTTHRKVRRG